MGLTFLTNHIQFGRAEAGGQGFEHRIGIGAATDNFEQTAPCIGAIVKAIPTLFEENVAAHFATQGGLTASGLNFFHLGLDQ